MLTLARQIQRHPTRGELVHVDFVRIRRDVAVSADVPLHLIGEPTGVRDGGLLEQLMFQLTVEAKPGNIPVSIEIDVPELDIGDQLPRRRPPAPDRRHHARSTPTSSSRRSRRRASPSRGGGRRGRRRRGRSAPRAARRPTPRATSDDCAATSDRVARGAGAPPPTCSSSGSATRATSTRARATTSAPRPSSCSRKRHGATLRKGKERALADEVRIGGKRVALAIPLTYMNDSGLAVAALARRYGVEPDQIVIVHDELDLPGRRAAR